MRIEFYIETECVQACVSTTYTFYSIYAHFFLLYYLYICNLRLRRYQSTGI